MNAWTTPLRTGLPLIYDGEQFTIAEIEGRRILLQQISAEGRPTWRQISTHPILPTTVSREWLEREYSHKGRTTLDIAHELGFHKNTVTKNLKRWGIPRHSNGLFSNPFASLDIPLSSDMKKVSRTKNCLPRLRHLLQLPGHRNLSAAAASLGVHPGTLSHQLRSLEATLEFALITRTNPLSSTLAGAQFLAEAQRLIDLLKAEPSTPSLFSAASIPCLAKSS